MELRESQRICVSGEAGTVIGEIVGVETPETMPNCHPDPCTNEEAKRILLDWGVTRLAIISYFFGTLPVMFTALEIGGSWYDMKRNAIELLPVPQHTPMRRTERSAN